MRPSLNYRLDPTRASISVTTQGIDHQRDYELDTHQQVVKPIEQKKIIAGKVFTVIKVVRAMPFIDGSKWLDA